MKAHLVGAVLVVLLALLLCHPGRGGIGRTVIASERSDLWNTMWLSGVVADRVSGETSALKENLALGFPDRIDLWPHLGGILWPLLFAPLTLTLGPVATHNLSGLFALCLSALLSYLFFYEISGDKKPAFFAALLFGCGLYGMEEIRFGNPELAAFFSVPLSALATVRVFDRGGARRTLLAAAALAFAVAFNPYFGLVAAAFLVFAAIQAAGDMGPRKAALYAAICLAGGLVLSLPATLPLLSSLFSAGRPSVAVEGAGWDLLEPIFFSRSYPRTLIYTFLVVAFLGLYKAEKGYRFWLLAAGGFFLLSLGPSLHIWGRDTGIPTPMALLQELPGLWRARYSYRFAIGMHLCLGAATAITLRRVLEAADEIGIPDALLGRVILLYAIVAVLLTLPNAATSLKTPPVYEFLSQRSDEGAIMELPFARDFYTNSRWLYYQRLHRRPIITGRALPDLPVGYNRRAFRDNALFAALTKGFPGDSRILETWDMARDRAALAALGVRFALVHTRVPGGAATLKLARRAFGEALYTGKSESLFLVKNGG